MLCFFFFLEGGRNFHLLHLFLHMHACPPCSVMSLDCSQPGFPVHGTFQAGILEWVAISYSISSAFELKIIRVNFYWMTRVPWAKHFTCFITFNPHNNPNIYMLILSPFYSLRNWHLKELNNSPKVIYFSKGGLKFQIYLFWLQKEQT